MARGVNKVILIGNLGGDPQIRALPSGSSVCNFTLATTDSWKDRQTGAQQERTEWHRVAIFGRLAEVAGQYLHKGSKVYIEGRLQTRKWQGQDGQDRYTTEVVVDIGGQMQMLDSRQGGGQVQDPADPYAGSSEASANSAPSGGYAAPGSAPQKPATQPPVAAGGFMDDDIPF